MSNFTQLSNLTRLCLIKQLKYVKVYTPNIVLECSKPLIRGNVVGEHLIRSQCLIEPKDSQCQWEYLSGFYNVPYVISFSIFGNMEVNWLRFCKGHNTQMDLLLSYWVSIGYERFGEESDGFLRQIHNIENYILCPFKKELHTTTEQTLKTIKQTLQKNSVASIKTPNYEGTHHHQP